MARILIVDDELSLRQLLTIFLRKDNHDLDSAANGLEALEKLQAQRYDLVLLDIRMPRMGGLDLLDVIRERNIRVQVIVMTAFSTTETALEAMRKGAYDYIVKPMKLEELKVVIDKCLEKGTLLAENRELRKQLRATGKPRVELTYVSEQMATVEMMINRVAETPSNVLLLGESGTGKEVVARMLHGRSQRANRPMVAINCGAIPEPLMESELFGHCKGAFTGATKDKKGLFEAANGGSIFLDEIGELSIGLQVKLLRVLQERTVTPVGTTDEVPIDVRVIAATHSDLASAVANGRFRADLFFRLNVIHIELPPLRDRREDIMVLAEHFLAVLSRRMGRQFNGFNDEARKLMMTLPYSGNVRELENVIERAVALEPSDIITAAYLPDPGSSLLLRNQKTTGPRNNRHPIDQQSMVSEVLSNADECLQAGTTPLHLERLLTDIELGIMRAALDQTDGNKTEAAQLIGMSFRSFRYKLSKHENTDP